MIPPRPPEVPVDGTSEPRVEERRIDEPRVEERRIEPRAPRPAALLTRPGLPLVTLTLIALLGAIFGIEMWLGGAGTPTLARMGANIVARTRAGEVERLLAASTLHVAPWHAIMNLWVLYSLGRSLEALFGRTRFLLLYCASAVGGGIGTTMFGGEGASAGASGAIWGLLGASAVLAFRPIPNAAPEFVAAARRSALTNLALNLGISFLPGIDRWAHFGGGIVGAILVGLGILVPPAWTMARTGRPEDVTHRAALAGAAAFLSLATLTSVAVAWVRNRPWELVEAPTLVPVAIDATTTVGVPAELTETTPRAFGELRMDRMVIEVLGIEAASGTDAELTETVNQLNGFVPPGTIPVSGAVASRDASGASVSRVYEAGEIRAVRLIVFRPGRAVILDVISWTAYLDAQTLAAQIAASVQ